MFFRILVALSLLLPPQQAPPTGRSAPAIPHAQGEHVTVSGVPLWVESEGRGEPLLLISGGPGASHNYFHPGFTQLADAFRVIYFDAFGRGRSARAASPAQYTFDRDVRDIEALRVALGLGRIHVLGHSYGGMVALAYAKAHPEAVRSLTLANALSPGQRGRSSTRTSTRRFGISIRRRGRRWRRCGRRDSDRPIRSIRRPSTCRRQR